MLVADKLASNAARKSKAKKEKVPAAPGIVSDVLDMGYANYVDVSLQELEAQTSSPLTSITSLYLDNNSLLAISKPAIPSLTTLTNLNLSFNRLQKLPSAVSKLVNLKVLDASHNRLAVFPRCVTALFQVTFFMQQHKLINFSYANSIWRSIVLASTLPPLIWGACHSLSVWPYTETNFWYAFTFIHNHANIP